MEILDQSIFKKLFELFPLIQETTKSCVEKELSKYSHDINRITKEIETFRPILKLIQGKYIIEIMYLIYILDSVHYNTLEKILTGISSRTLATRLKLLEEKGIIERKIEQERPVRVSYRTTKYGENFIALLAPALIYAVFDRSNYNRINP